MTRHIVFALVIIWLAVAALVGLGAIIINAAIASDGLALMLMFLYATLLGFAGQGLTLRVIHHG